eukprot:gene12520-12654_t
MAGVLQQQVEVLYGGGRDGEGTSSSMLKDKGSSTDVLAAPAASSLIVGVVVNASDAVAE